MIPPTKETLHSFSPEFLATIEDAVSRYYLWEQADMKTGDLRCSRMTLFFCEIRAAARHREFIATGLWDITDFKYDKDNFEDLGGHEFSFPVPADDPLAGRFSDGRVVVRVFGEENSLPDVTDSEDPLLEYLSGIEVGDSGMKLVAIPGGVLEMDKDADKKVARYGYVFYLVENGVVTKLTEGMPQTASDDFSRAALILES